MSHGSLRRNLKGQGDIWMIFGKYRGVNKDSFLFISVSRSCLSSLNSQVQLHFLYESDFIPCLLNVFLLQTEAPLLACFHDSKRNMMMMKVTIMTKIGDDNGFWSNSHFHWGSDWGLFFFQQWVRNTQFPLFQFLQETWTSKKQIVFSDFGRCNALQYILYQACNCCRLLHFPNIISFAFPTKWPLSPSWFI